MPRLTFLGFSGLLWLIADDVVIKLQICNQGVAGSNPATGTNYFKGLDIET